MILIERSIQRIQQIDIKTGYRPLPNLFNSTIGVQPITQPNGIYFALRYLYSNNTPSIPCYTPMDFSSLYPNKINVTISIPSLKFVKNYIWHRSKKKKI